MADLFPRGTAVLSPCGTYRYRLVRRWAEGPTCGFVMLNPSTADAEKDDPTIRRCLAFARREDCGGLIVVNLFALRSTSPAALYSHPYPHGPAEVAETSQAIAEMDGPAICAWGAHAAAVSQASLMLDMIRANGKVPMCLGKTKDGHPRHPLYVKADAPLVPLLDGREHDGFTAACREALR